MKMGICDGVKYVPLVGLYRADGLGEVWEKGKREVERK